jgi:hypothetical protein
MSQLTKADLGFIKKYYLKYTDEQLASMFQKSPITIRLRRCEMQCYREPGGRFKKGNKPVATARPKGPNATSFKKGHQPANSKQDGAISIRDTKGTSYKWIRVSPGNWQLYHRFLWEQYHGAIPSGYLVTFKDGNTLNCVIDNLELITRAENVIRNQNRPKAAASARRTNKIHRNLAKIGIYKGHQARKHNSKIQ